MARDRLGRGGATRLTLGVRLPIMAVLVVVFGALLTSRPATADTPTPQPIPTTTSHPGPTSVPPGSGPDDCLIGTWWLASYDHLDTNTNDPGPTTFRTGGLAGVRLDIRPDGSGTWDFSDSDPETYVLNGVHRLLDGSLAPYTINHTFVVRGTLTALIVRDGSRAYAFASTSRRGTLTSTWTDDSGATRVDKLNGLVGMDFNPVWTLTCTTTTLTNLLPPASSGPTQSWKLVWHHERTGSTPAETPTPNGNSESATAPNLCDMTLTDGWFEPAQAVWQDDPTNVSANYFADDRGRQLRRLPTNNSLTVEYAAELPMVKDKPTLLYGISHAAGQQSYPVGERFDIYMTGMSMGTTNVPVRMRFTGSEGAAGLASTTPVITNLPLGAPCADKQQPFYLHFDVPSGTPATPFAMKTAGAYEIDNELLASDEPTGASVRVYGTVVATKAPSIAVFPVYFSSASSADLKSLKSAADGLADEANLTIPDYFPLAPGSLKVMKEATVDITEAMKAGAATTSSDFNKAQPARVDVIRAQLTRLLGLDSALGSGTRVVLVLRDVDYAQVDPSPNPALYHSLGSGGFASTQKVIILTQAYLSASELAHELAHTLPFPWLGDTPACGTSYHNVDAHYAHGVRITRDGKATTPEAVNVNSIMGPGARYGRPEPPTWIDQCTYAHLLGYLNDPPDPAAVLVQGMLARTGGSEQGVLLPAYTLDSPVDLNADGTGDHAVVLRAADGSELARYPFTVHWVTFGHPDASSGSNGAEEHSLLYFSYRVPQVAGTSAIEVLGPDGAELAHLALSPQAPRLSVSAPMDGATIASDSDMVDVRWHTDTASGTTAVATVLYSSDGGHSFSPVVVESTVTEQTVRLAAEGDHIIKVVVSDGSQSATSVIHLHRATHGVPWLLIAVAGIVAGSAAGFGVILARRRRQHAPVTS